MTDLKKTEEDAKRWENIPCSWIGRINNVKMSMLPRAIYTFNVIPIKIPWAFFRELEQIILRFVRNQTRPRIARGILKKKTRARASQCRISGCTTKLWSSRLCGTGTKTHRSMGQNRESRSGPSTLWSTNIPQSRKTIHWKKDHLFNKWCWENWTATCRRMKLDHSLTPHKDKLKMDERSM